MGIPEARGGMADADDPSRRPPVLAALLSPATDDQARRLATALGAARGSPVRFLAPPADGNGAVAEAVVAGGGTGQAATGAGGGPTVTTVEPGRASHRAISSEVLSSGADVLALQRPEADSRVGLRPDTVERVVSAVPADVVVANGQGDLDDLASLLVPIAGGPNTALAIEVAVALAREADAWVEFFHVVPPGSSEEDRRRGSDLLDGAGADLEDFERFDTWLYEAPDPASAIAEQSAYYDAVVMGAPTAGRLKRLVFGSTVDEVDRAIEVPLVTTHRS